MRNAGHNLGLSAARTDSPKQPTMWGFFMSCMRDDLSFNTSIHISQKFPSSHTNQIQKNRD